MGQRVHDPLRLDLVACAADAVELSGQWPGSALARLARDQAAPDDAPPPPVHWRASAEQRAVAGGEHQLWLHLTVRTTVWLTCQRCLQPYEHAIDIDRQMRFVADEASAEALDAESEDDVLALPRWLDLRQLVEDELLLALPLVPRHATCPQPLTAAAAPPPDTAHPFAVLQALKGRKPGNGGPADD